MPKADAKVRAEQKDVKKRIAKPVFMVNKNQCDFGSHACSTYLKVLHKLLQNRSCGEKRGSDKVIKAPVVKPTETPEQKKAREAEAAKLKATEEAVRRKAAEEAQKRTLEQMRQMASKYSNDDATTTIRVIDDSPLAAGLVGQAYEDSFNKEDH